MSLNINPKFISGDMTTDEELFSAIDALDKSAIGLSNVDNTSDLSKDSSHFEKISRNLRSYPQVFNYSGDKISTIVYTIGPSTSITKTFNYTGDSITSIVLSGNLPSELGGITTKTLTYTAGKLSAVSYS